MAIVRRDVGGSVLFIDLDKKEIHISDLPKMIDMKEGEGEKAYTSDTHEMADVSEEVEGESLNTEYGAR
ncbi:MAG: hypothetical protein QMC78_03470 [Methanocellales archaeon]|nr:hypothetical protein [Methanocellales archaeon]